MKPLNPYILESLGTFANDDEGDGDRNDVVDVVDRFAYRLAVRFRRDGSALSISPFPCSVRGVHTNVHCFRNLSLELGNM